jgi:hypothetical protein
MLLARGSRTRAPYLVAILVLVAACEKDPTAQKDLIDPAGVWQFGVLVAVATGACDGEAGEAWSFPITITKTGSAPPYDIVAKGFLGDPTNVLEGTFTEDNQLVVSGSYPEDGGTTEPRHELVAVSDDRLEGNEYWDWNDGEGNSCPGSRSLVTADRIN